jgi:ABC-type branched-subunit amino acid transport system substrate-binding protein
VAKASYARGTLDVEGAVETISNSGAEAVILVGTYAPSAKFVKLCKEKGFKPIFQAVSFVGADEFAKEMGSYAEGVIVSQVVPPPSGLDVLGGTVKYRELLKKSYPNDRPNFVGLEGFVNAKVIVEGLKRAGQEITREKFVDALESMKDFSLGVGYPVNFSKESHQGLEYIYFTIIEKGEFKFFTDWKKELSGQLKGRQ